MDNNQMDKFLGFEKKWITFLKKKWIKKKTYAHGAQGSQP